MQFTDQVSWSIGDFIIMGALLLGASTCFAILDSKVKDRSKSIVIGIVIGLVFLYVWVELAVGIFFNLGF